MVLECWEVQGTWEVLMVSASPQGCVEKIGLWLRKNVLVVAAAALGIAFVEVRDGLGRGRVPGCTGVPRAHLGWAAFLTLHLPILLDPGHCPGLLPRQEHPKWL